MEVLISAHSQESGARNSARCNLDGAVTLGRGPESPVPLDGNGISREHLRLHVEGDGVFITDLSSNGTWVNTQRLTRGRPHPLTPADAIKIPGFEIRVDPQSIPAAAVRPAPPAAPVLGNSTEPAPPQGGPLASVRVTAASFSKVERLLIALALATVALIAIYLTAG